MNTIVTKAKIQKNQNVDISNIYNYLSIPISMYLYIQLSIYPYIHYLYIQLSIYPYIHVSIYTTIYLSIYSCIYIYNYLSIHISMYLYIKLSIYPYIHVSIYTTIYLFIYPTIPHRFRLHSEKLINFLDWVEFEVQKRHAQALFLAVVIFINYCIELTTFGKLCSIHTTYATYPSIHLSTYIHLSIYPYIHLSNQGYNARKVISEVYASFVLQCTVSGR